MKPYESDITKFIREFLDKHPEEVEKQKKARADWWDKPQDLNERRKLDDSEVPQKGYVYYENPE